MGWQRDSYYTNPYTNHPLSNNLLFTPKSRQELQEILELLAFNLKMHDRKNKVGNAIISSPYVLLTTAALK